MAAQSFLVESDETLREYLDTDNEAGRTATAVGVDEHGTPFLVTLIGPYADTEDVFVGSPWDGEVDYGTGERCGECSGANPLRIDALHYPVTVLVPSGAQCDESCHESGHDDCPRCDSLLWPFMCDSCRGAAS